MTDSTPVIIKIDRSTIRRNPSAGSTTTMVAVMKYVDDNGTIRQHVREYGHEPEPEWLYEYIPTEVRCCECGGTFKHTELRDDYTYTEDDNEFWSSNVCPLCGTWDYCEVEYEKLTDALRAEAKEPKP